MELVQLAPGKYHAPSTCSPLETGKEVHVDHGITVRNLLQLVAEGKLTLDSQLCYEDEVDDGRHQTYMFYFVSVDRDKDAVLSPG